MTTRKKATKPKKARRRRPVIDLLAQEGSVGKRLRKIEEALNISEPSGQIAATFIMFRAEHPTAPEWDAPEGPFVAPNGFVTGTYHLGPDREVTFWGPRGVTSEAAESIHRTALERLIAEHPEYLKPRPKWVEPRGLTLNLGTPEQFVIRRDLITNTNS